MSKSRPILLSACIVLSALSSCNLLRPTAGSASNPILLDTMEIDLASGNEAPYQIPPPKTVDVYHIELDLKFDWDEEAVLGKAKVHLGAYSEPQDTIELDARGFELHRVVFNRGDTMLPANHLYDGTHLRIIPSQPLLPGDTQSYHIHYTARPSQLSTHEGAAIASDQGLYFIQPMSNLGKPAQIWTQGEPSCNSSWFPSVDEPHEKITHEIFLTVDSAYHTISNGRMLYSSDNGDGTRTDYWRQDLPHANYLVMLAIGEFALVKDQWEDVPVWYYLDSLYESEAMAIFGNTPEMIGYFSELLDHRYPWPKYHQVVVKDFVSGAMENTSAVIHGDFVQRSERELLDQSYEDVIAHELFHHWFGDLVTCESWSQLTMNEGFATYGEVLWEEHKYGSDAARLKLQSDLTAYLGEARLGAKPLIRHRYHHPDDVFDSHTYQKGGGVLHMLRQEVGDEVFFQSLTAFLEEYAYQSVEVDEFRLCVERISGRDLQWFFDQWFHTPGHPEVRVDLSNDPDSLRVQIEQTQFPNFRVRVPIVVAYENQRLDTHYRYLSEREQSFRVPLKEKPLWYAVDPDGDLLWEKEVKKPMDVWAGQLESPTSYIARLSALEQVAQDSTALASAPLDALMADPFWAVRQRATQVAAMRDGWTGNLKAQLIELTQLDEHSSVRALAYQLIDSLSGGDSAFKPLYLYGMQDRSYRVVGACLRILQGLEPCLAAEQATTLIDDPFGDLWLSAAAAFASCPQWEHHAFFQSQSKKRDGLGLFLLNNHYITYVEGMGEEPLYAALCKSLKRAAAEGTTWWETYSALQGLRSAKQFYSDQIEAIESNASASPEDLAELQELRAKKGVISADIARYEAGLTLPGGATER